MSIAFTVCTTAFMSKIIPWMRICLFLNLSVPFLVAEPALRAAFMIISNAIVSCIHCLLFQSPEPDSNRRCFYFRITSATQSTTDAIWAYVVRVTGIEPALFQIGSLVHHLLCVTRFHDSACLPNLDASRLLLYTRELFAIRIHEPSLLLRDLS
jgi:hypothetical protein